MYWFGLILTFQLLTADSLAPVAARLKKILDRSVQFIPWHAFPEMEAEITKNKNARLFLLENIRFSPDEEKNTPALARTLAQLADIFVLDGFAVAHRRAASVSGVARYLPAYAGLLLEQEIKGLTMAAKKHRGKTVFPCYVISYRVLMWCLSVVGWPTLI